MNEEEAKIWKQGYEAGVKATQRANEDAIKIGTAILEVMYNKFEQLEEDD